MGIAKYDDDIAIIYYEEHKKIFNTDPPIDLMNILAVKNVTRIDKSSKIKKGGSKLKIRYK